MLKGKRPHTHIALLFHNIGSQSTLELNCFSDIRRKDIRSFVFALEKLDICESGYYDHCLITKCWELVIVTSGFSVKITLEQWEWTKTVKYVSMSLYNLIFFRWLISKSNTVFSLGSPTTVWNYSLHLYLCNIDILCTALMCYIIFYLFVVL